MLTFKEWVVKGEKRCWFLEIRSMAWEARVLVRLSVWIMKSPGLVAGVGVESSMSRVPNSPGVVKGILPAYFPLRHKALGQRSTFALF